MEGHELYYKFKLLQKIQEKIMWICIQLILIVCVENACLNFTSGEPYPIDESSYCGPIIQWAVSEETLLEVETLDKTALSNYQKLYTQYYKTGNVSIDCLGMAKYFFCASAFPTCHNDQMSIEVICSWLCDLFSVRCGQNNSFFQSICVEGNINTTICAGEIFIAVGLLWLLFLNIM